MPSARCSYRLLCLGARARQHLATISPSRGCAEPAGGAQNKQPIAQPTCWRARVNRATARGLLALCVLVARIRRPPSPRLRALRIQDRSMSLSSRRRSISFRGVSDVCSVPPLSGAAAPPLISRRSWQSLISRASTPRCGSSERPGVPILGSPIGRARRPPVGIRSSAERRSQRRVSGAVCIGACFIEHSYTAHVPRVRPQRPVKKRSRMQ